MTRSFYLGWPVQDGAGIPYRRSASRPTDPGKSGPHLSCLAQWPTGSVCICSPVPPLVRETCPASSSSPLTNTPNHVSRPFPRAHSMVTNQCPFLTNGSSFTAQSKALRTSVREQGDLQAASCSGAKDGVKRQKHRTAFKVALRTKSEAASPLRNIL